MEQTYWKRCSTCKKEIGFGDKYYRCSVSTCQHKRKGFQFCSIECWDAHLGYMRHREAWAEEMAAPLAGAKAGFNVAQIDDRLPRRTVVAAKEASPSSRSAASRIETDTLVVVSRVKELIKQQSGFGTSQCCIDVLTQRVAADCLRAIEHAKAAGRKTVMGRDL